MKLLMMKMMMRWEPVCYKTKWQWHFVLSKCYQWGRRYVCSRFYFLGDTRIFVTVFTVCYHFVLQFYHSQIFPKMWHKHIGWIVHARYLVWNAWTQIFLLLNEFLNRVPIVFSAAFLLSRVWFFALSFTAILGASFHGLELFIEPLD